MKKLAKILLFTSVAALTVSLTGPGSEILYGGLKPLGAIAFVAFFITNMLAKEFQRYDAEEEAKAAPVKKEHRPEPKVRRVLQHA